MDTLDQEASEDEGARRRGVGERLPSHEANVELTSAERRYRQMLDHAGESDEHIRAKWEEWEEAVGMLMWDEVRIRLLSFLLTTSVFLSVLTMP